VSEADNDGAPQSAQHEVVPAPAKISLKEFLESIPPGRHVEISDVITQSKSQSHSPRYELVTPVLHLHCEKCGGVRSFVAVRNDSAVYLSTSFFPVNVMFRCRNCETNIKRYALLVQTEGAVANIYKMGELPEFGPPTPSKVISLIRDEREYYFKGRRSENQGLGIAAFAYYRRVVENQKDKIFSEVIRASKKVGAPEAMIADLERARKETQFHKAMESIRPAVPQALLIDGQNPLMLLHNALSEGLHAQTDDECLELATSIRVVLTELVDRMASVLADHVELKTAVSKLMDVQSKRKPQA
jgi:hypothetical protein